jgi:hypothetical protein
MQALVHLFAPESGEWSGAGLRAVRSLVLVHAAVRTVRWLPVAFGSGELPVAALAGIGALMVLAAAGGTVRRFARGAALLGALAILAQLLVAFPDADDALYLEVACLTLLGLLDADDAEDGALLRSALCWMGVLVLFHSGLQRLLYGYYFEGEALLTGIATLDPLSRSLQWMLAPGEVAKLMQLKVAMQGAGPFRTASTSFVAVSNALWAMPLLLAALIALRRTRTLAALAAIAFVLLLGTWALEIMTGMLLAQLLLLCVPGEWNRRLFWVFVLVYAGIGLGGVSVLLVRLWSQWGGA